MRKDTYINFIEYTLSTYNYATKNKLLNMYKNEKIAIKKEKQVSLFGLDSVEIDYDDIDGTLSKCIREKEKAIEIYEKFQFTKSYRYSVLFKYPNFDSLIEKIEKIPEYEYQSEDIRLDDKLNNPKKMSVDNYIILLFDKKFEAVHPQTSEELLLHYPLVVVLHRENKIIEFRFDSIKRLFVEGENNQSIYVEIINQILDYFKQTYQAELDALDLTFMKNIADSEDFDNIKLISQYMNMKNGGKAELNVGNNEEYVLPIIGELKNIMNDLKEELDKNVKIKDALEQFIYEKEETTDYPWIEVLFLNSEGIKTRHNHVKFTFNYMNKKYSLVTYYYNSTLIEMGRMNDVTRFIGENTEK